MRRSRTKANFTRLFLGPSSVSSLIAFLVCAKSLDLRPGLGILKSILGFVPVLKEHPEVCLLPVVVITVTMSQLDKNLVLVLLYDLCFGRKKIEGGGKYKRIVLTYRSPLHAAVVRMKVDKILQHFDCWYRVCEQIKMNVTHDIELLPEHLRCSGTGSCIGLVGVEFEVVV